MAHHDFGILAEHEERSDAYFPYTPEKFGCIRVDMDVIDACDLFSELQDLPTYIQRISRPAQGFDEAGITLIPPGSLPRLRRAAAQHGLTALAALARRAEQMGCFVIHFGI